MHVGDRQDFLSSLYFFAWNAQANGLRAQQRELTDMVDELQASIGRYKDEYAALVSAAEVLCFLCSWVMLCGLFVESGY